MKVTFTAAEWRNFLSGKEVIEHLEALGMKAPREAKRERHPDGSLTFEEVDE